MPDLAEIINVKLQEQQNNCTEHHIHDSHSQSIPQPPTPTTTSPAAAGTRTPVRKPGQLRSGGITPSGTPRAISYELPRTGSGTRLSNDVFGFGFSSGGGLSLSMGSPVPWKEEDEGTDELGDEDGEDYDGEDEGYESAEKRSKDVKDNGKDWQRLPFNRLESEFKGGFDIDDPSQREKVSIISPLTFVNTNTNLQEREARAKRARDRDRQGLFLNRRFFSFIDESGDRERGRESPQSQDMSPRVSIHDAATIHGIGIGSDNAKHGDGEDEVHVPKSKSTGATSLFNSRTMTGPSHSASHSASASASAYRPGTAGAGAGAGGWGGKGRKSTSAPASPATPRTKRRSTMPNLSLSEFLHKVKERQGQNQNQNQSLEKPISGGVSPIDGEADGGDGVYGDREDGGEGEGKSTAQRWAKLKALLPRTMSSAPVSFRLD